MIDAQCSQWMMVFIRMVNFSDDLAKVHLDLFLDKAEALQLEGAHKALIEYVSCCIV